MCGNPHQTLCVPSGISIILITMLSLLWAAKRSMNNMIRSARCNMSPTARASAPEFPPVLEPVREAGDAIGICRRGSHQTSKSRREPEAICRVS